MLISKLWRRIKQELIQRRVPYAVLSWRYLVPDQSLSVQRHRAVLINAWPQLPRPLWWLLAVYSYLRWYLLFGWMAWYRVFFKFRRSDRYQALARTDADKQLGSATAQAFDLALLTVQGIPPHFYYQYRLFRHLKAQWLDFVYTHELPYWHQLLSPDITDEERGLLTDKVHFANVMGSAGLPVIETLYSLQQGDKIEAHTLFQERSLFIKPQCGSQKRDCYTLDYDQALKRYTLKGEADILDPSEITHAIQALADKQPMIIQPLLQNHKALADYCGDGMLATIRLITVCSEKGCFSAASAILEIPVKCAEKLVIPLTIACKTGRISAEARELVGIADREMAKQLTSLDKTCLPLWKEVINTVETAHKAFSNVYSIGWDLAVTEDGIRLLEGNFNWGVAMHQRKLSWAMLFCTTPPH